MDTIHSEIPAEAYGVPGRKRKEPGLDMNQIVGSHDVLFVCLDTLRYDVAKEQEAMGLTPHINGYGPWKKCHAPGNFTYPSHHAMFSGFLPSPAEPVPLLEREMLFFPRNIGMGGRAPEGAYAFDGPTWIEGLAKAGYETICVGGVAFFDKRSDIGRVFPGMFQKSYWNPSFGCGVRESFDHQTDWIRKVLQEADGDRRICMYVNVDSIHYPNYFYGDTARPVRLGGEMRDNLDTHAAALRYVDQRIEGLFDLFRNRGKTLVILCSDHGTCYGEDGYQFHSVSHEVVYTVPYKHFIIS